MSRKNATVAPNSSGGPRENHTRRNSRIGSFLLLSLFVTSAAAQTNSKAAEQLQREEKQRILGIIPDFNTSNEDAARLSRTQKMQLAFKSATDPFAFVTAGIDAGLSQASDGHAGYGQGMPGYAKRFGASYADSFDGTMIGNGIL
ncbi:MAG TPA: hypothetical protein VGK64_15275, partial [Bryobacteraceae bacterium]